MNGCGRALNDREISLLATSCLTAAHAAQFTAYVRQVRGEFSLTKILNGEQRWPERPEERDVLYFLVQSFRARF